MAIQHHFLKITGWVAAIFLLLIYNQSAKSQSATIPQGSPSYHMLDRLEIKCGKLMEGFHSVNKPIDRIGAIEFVSYLDTISDCELSDVDLANMDYLYLDNMEWSKQGRAVSRKPIFKIFYKQPANFLSVDKPHFQAVVNPVAQITAGYDIDDQDGNSFRQLNTKGFEVRGQIDKMFGFYTFFTSEQAFYPSYIKDEIDENKAVPGAGYYKQFKDGGYDYFRAKGYITFTPSKYIGLQFGHDKNFIGDGYRSMLLSDFSNDYLFLKLNTRVWRLNYTNIFAELTREYPRRSDTLLNKKYMAVHHLSYNVTKWLNIGIFEAVVFSRSNQFELQYLNPIIFYRAVEQMLGSPDNAQIGFDFKANFAQRFSLYGQFLLDEMNFGREFNFGNRNNDKGFLWELTHPRRWRGTKFATQLGLKYIDVFGIDNLDLQIEGNMARPYTYSHSQPRTSWTHYNQPLAHPLGANFTEIITILRYQPSPKLFIMAKHIRAKYGEDADTTNWGKNIFVSNGLFEREFDNFVGQGVRTKLNLTDIIFTYMPWHNVSFDFNYRFRRVNSALDERDRNSHFVNLTWRYNIPYRHYDF
jgi:hypothetical protein